MTQLEFLDVLGEINENALICGDRDNPDYLKAIVGYAERCGQPALVVYDREKVIQCLMKDLKCDRQGAEEFFEFNVAGAWVGEHTPLFLTKVEDM